MFARIQKTLANLGQKIGRTGILAILLVAGGLLIGALIGRSMRQDGERLAYRFEPGQRWRHQLQFTGTGAMDLNVVTGGKNADVTGQQIQSIHTTVEGELITDILQRDEQKALVAVSMPKAKVVLFVSNLPQLDGAANIEADLALPAFVELDLQGRIQSIRFAPQTRDLSRNCLRTLLAATQVCLPGHDDASDVWEAWQQSPSGRCRAVYQPDPEAPGGKTLLKTCEEFEQTTADKPGLFRQPAVTLHPEGALRIAFDPEHGLVNNIKGTESLTTKIEGRVLSTSENTITLTFLKKETILTPDLNVLVELAKERTKSEAPETLKSAFTSRGDGLQNQKQVLGSATFESLQADLAREESSAKDKDQTSLYLKIKALIAVHPETSSRWAEMVKAAPPESLAMRLVPTALEAAGNEPSQAALVAIVKARENDEAVAERLLTILAQLKTPSPLAENTLHELATHSQTPALARLSQLGLGNMARNLRDSSPARAEKIIAWAVQKLSTAHTDGETSHWLLVLGNIGSEQTLPAIRPRLDDQASTIRMAAVSALRFIATNQAETLLLQTLKNDPDVDVRCAVISSLRYRQLSKEAFQANRAALLADKSVSVRLAALSLLWEVRQRYPEIISLVQGLTAPEQPQELREAAARLLASIEKGE